MPALRRPTKLFIVLSYLVLSAAPFLSLLAGRALANPWRLAATELLCWALLWGLFKRPANFHWLLLPAFVALPAELYLQLFFGQGLTAHHLGILAESNPMEALEFAGSGAWGMAALLLGAAGWWWLVWRAARRTHELDWQGSSRWLCFAIGITVVALTAYGLEFGVRGLRAQPPADTAAKDDAFVDLQLPVEGAHLLGIHGAPPLPNVVRIAGELKVAATWPFGLAGRAYDFYKERQDLARLAAGNANFRFHATQAGQDQAPEVVVLVLGESSRFDRWSLNGYARPTNPLLAQERNLVMLGDVVTPVTVTRLSVPLIVSRKPAQPGMEPGFSEKSFITAYKEAGFKTWWLSNQLTVGRFDTPVSVYANEADQMQHLNLGGFNHDSTLDEALLAPLQRALAAPAPKKLIVLHTLGSHWNYSRRHPASFNHWQPSLFGMDRPTFTDRALRPLLSNSYDNSILYTDWLLSQVIGQLKTQKQRAALLYVSDHGEVINDDDCDMQLHGRNTVPEFHVPAFMWYSEQYRQHYPDKVSQLERHRQAKLATTNFFHLLLDVADIRYPGERRDWSILDAGFRPSPRWVSSGAWTDYDKATISGACHVVVAGPVQAGRDK